jgi:hypothetical protein
LRFVTGKVSAEHADMAAEKLTNMFHGEEDDMQEGYNPNSVDAQHRRELEAHRRQEVEKKAAAGDENAKRWLERDDERKAAMRAEYDRRMERESVSNEGGIPGNVPTEKIPGKEDLLKGKGRSYYEGSYYGPEDFQDWLKDATHRVAQGRVSDWTELAAELSTELGMDDDKADRIAQRIYGHDKLAQYRVKPQDDLEKDIPSDSGEDDDAEFLNKLRSQARSGSIKQGADTGEKDESVSESPMNALQEVAQLVMGFYDRDNGTWTKGEHGVVTHVKRQFSDEEGNGGEREAELAAKLIQHLNAKHEATQQFEDIKKLAGLKIAEEKTVERDPKTGKVTSWKDEGEWKKSEKKDPRGKVTNLSDKARKETEKLAASSSKK